MCNPATLTPGPYSVRRVGDMYRVVCIEGYNDDMDPLWTRVEAVAYAVADKLNREANADGWTWVLS